MIGETDWGMVWGDKVGEWMRVGGKGECDQRIQMSSYNMKKF